MRNLHHSAESYDHIEEERNILERNPGTVLTIIAIGVLIAFIVVFYRIYTANI